MLAVETWAKGKHYIIQLFAPHLASAIEGMYEEFSTLKRRRISEQKGDRFILCWSGREAAKKRLCLSSS